MAAKNSTPALKVLLIEDDPGDARLVREVLDVNGTEAFKVVHVVRLVDSLDQLRQHPYDAVLLDLSLPDSEGLESVRHVHSQAPTVPIIAFAEAYDEDGGVRAIQEGAQDVLLKSSIPSGVLAGALRCAIERQNLVNALQDRERELRVAHDNMEQLIAGNSDAVLVVDESDVIAFANPASEKLLGRGFEELSGSPFKFSAESHDPSQVVVVRPDGREMAVEMCSSDVVWDGKHARLVTLRKMAKRKTTESTLRASEETLRAVVDACPSAIYLKDKNARYVLVNRIYCELVGPKAESIIGKKPHDFLPSGLAEQVTLQDRRVIETRTTQTFEIERPGPDGNLRHELVVKFPIFDEEGEVVAVGGVTTDIGHRKRAEERLRESRAQYLNLIETVPFGIQEMDTDGKLTYCNSFCSDLFGYPVDELIGTNSSDLLPKDQRAGMRAHFARLAEVQPDPSVFSGKSLTKDGRVIDVEVAWNYKRDQAGDVVGFVAVVSDVTDRLQAEEKVRKLFRAVEQSPSAVLVTDTQGRIEYTNPKFTEITGFSAEEALGKTPRILKTDETPREIYNELWASLTAGNVWRGVFHNRRKDGSIYPAASIISPIRDKDREVTHFVGIQNDITERLETESRLRQAEKMEALGRLAGGIAHDFNNMLLPVRALTEMTIAELPEHSAASSRLGKVVDASKRAQELVQEILAFSRAEKVSKQKADMADVVRQALELIRATLPRTIQIKTAIDPDVGLVEMDCSQIQTVVLNLASNAADAMDGRPGTLELNLSRISVDEARNMGNASLQPGDYARLILADTGTGMDAETVQRVFEPFFTTKEVGKGTGLGLAMVHGIIEKHEGAITVDSRPGAGTRFEICLPICPDPEPQPLSSGQERRDNSVQARQLEETTQR